jgi:hypothetical protein
MPLSYLLIFILFWSTLGFATRAIQLRKPGVPLFPSWLQSPGNHLFFADRFTEAGLRARRIAMLSGALLVLVFVISYFGGFLQMKPNQSMERTAARRAVYISDD